MQIKRPNKIKVFAANAMQGDYLPVKFGTNIVVAKEDFADVANKNFEYGLESLEGDLQMKDLNTAIFYHSALLKYLFEKGIPEFSTYEDYKAGSIVQYDGNVWIATKDIKASTHEKVFDPCDPCGCKVECETPVYPSKEAGWCKFITSCEYDLKIKNLEDTDAALQRAIDNLKGVENFSILPNSITGNLELNLELSDGSHLVIPMTKFGHIEKNNDGSLSITNANGTTLELPKFVAEKDLDQQKGFFFNAQSGKWEVDLADLVQNGSGLSVDRNGNISVKPSDLVDNTTIRINGVSGKMEVNPDYYRTNFGLPLEGLTARVTEIETNGAKVFVESPIKGTGKRDNPLGLKISEDFYVDATGKLALNSVAPQDLGNTTFNNVNYKLGFHTFTGLIDSVARRGVLGLPLDIGSVAHEQNMSTAWTDFTVPQKYDFNGYYIASGNEVNVWVAHNDSVWTISNDSGVNPNGTLKDPTAWGKWQKLDNTPSVTSEMLKKLQEQINALGAANTAQDSEINALKANLAALGGKTTTVEGKTTSLEGKVKALEDKNNETCKIPCKNVNTDYTVVDADNTIITTNTSPITITLPNNIPVGRTFTIVQGSSGKVTLANGGNSKFIKPREGSLVLGGQDAAVTVIYELNETVRIFGDTETA